MFCRYLSFTAPYQITIETETLPEPAAGQVLVRTLVSAISAGTELLAYRGQLPPDMALDSALPALAGTCRYPLRYGYSAVGRVAALGPDVPLHWLGRLVFAFHPHQDYFLAETQELQPVPAALTPEEAAFFPNMETAVNLVMDGQPRLGERVLVLGQGVVGLLTTALLSRFPLSALISLERCPLRRQAALACGAQLCLDPAAEEDRADLAGRLLLHEQRGGADLTFELSGVPEALDLAIALTGFEGRIVIGSWYGQKRASLDLGGRFHRSRQRLISSQVSTLASELQGRWDKIRRYAVVWQMLQQVRPAHLITQRFSFEQAAQAYRLLDEHPDQAIQILLTYS